MLFMTVPEVMFVSAAENNPGYTVSLSPPAESVETENEFTVSVLVSAETSGAAVAALQTGITFDTKRVEYVSVSEPSGSGLEAEASVSDKTVILGVYGDSQSIPDGGNVVMAQLTFRALEAGDASFSISSAVAGMSGSAADIPAAAAEAVSVAITESSSAASGDYDLTFGMENDGLTWTVLTVGGETVNRELRGGETAENIADRGDVITFRIEAPDNVQYTNVQVHTVDLYSPNPGIQSLREATLKTQSDGVYTFVMPSHDYFVDATTLTIPESDQYTLTATLLGNRTEDDNSTVTINVSLADIVIEGTDSTPLNRLLYSTDGGENWSLTRSYESSGEGTYILDSLLCLMIYEDNPALDYFSLDNKCIQLSADFSGETITSVSSEEDLLRLAQAVNSGDNYEGVTVTLQNDIVLTKPWTEPIGMDETSQYGDPAKKYFFAGTFDGNGHTISGLDIDYTFSGVGDTDRENAKYFGLFGVLKNATIRDLTVTGTIEVDDPVTKWTSHNYRGQSCIGGIAARALENCNFIGCTSEVDITAHGGDIGGILGYTEHPDVTFTDCFNYGNLEVTKRNSSVCGIFSTSIYASSPYALLRCGNYGNITVDGEQIRRVNTGGQGSTSSTTTIEDLATGYAAGLTVLGSVNECFNKGNISGIAESAGGLLVTGSVSDSYNTGSISLTSPNDSYYSSPSSAGGIISIVETQNFKSQTLENCYSSGTVSNVSSDGVSGSLCGEKSDGLTVTNCYSSETDPSVSSVTAALLNGADRTVWKDDANSVNGGMPLLSWEDGEPSDGKHTVSFDTGEVAAKIQVFRDTDHTDMVEPQTDGTYLLPAATYYYTAEADGYFDISGTFTVTRRDIAVSVSFSAVAETTITVSPADADFELKDGAGNSVEPVSQEGGIYRYMLTGDADYTYTATAPGYNGITSGFTAGSQKEFTVTLSPSSYDPGADEDSYIYGSYNSGKTHTITAGGTYYVGHGDGKDGAQGTITIDTDQPVTLVGTGISTADAYEYLFIDCVREGVSLTLQDIYISNVGEQNNDEKVGNMIDFRGSDNRLSWRGTSILDHDQNAAGYAMIHVNQNTELTMGGAGSSDTLYMYKREQGAGVGGNGSAKGDDGMSAETNGTITVTGGTIFAKNSKQGAFFGSGAESASAGLTPGDISIEGGVINMISNSRGATIGGSAGSGGASSGSHVYVSGGTININVDFSGAAIGGGGYESGNDSDGGILEYTGGSIRTYIDQNATGNWGVSSAGIHGNKAITADIVNDGGDPLYLLILDTSKLRDKSGYYTVRNDGDVIYNGGLHEYRSVNEASEKGDQVEPELTIDNWTYLNEPNLYLYVTGEDHTLTVGEETIDVKWNDSSETFTLTYGSGETEEEEPAPGEGGTTTVETEVSVTDGTASVQVSEETISEAIDTAAAENSSTIRIEASSQENVSSTEVHLAGNSVSAVSEAGTSLEISTSNGSLTIPNDALKEIGEDLTVRITENEEGSVSLEIQDGSAPADLSIPVKLAFPVSGDDTEIAGSSSDVVWLVNEDGTRRIVPYGIVQDSQAVCLLDGSNTVVIGGNPKSFTDVSDTAWYADSVAFASAREMFDGVGDGRFDPQGTMTRAMLVQLLMNIEDGQAGPQAAAAFTDVSSDAWYADAVSWAADLGLVNGYGNGNFGPSDSITREQLAVLLYNYVRAMNYPVSLSVSGDLAQFSDADQVSSWSSEALSWAVGAGIINGNADGTLNPKGTATRAEVATLMTNFTRILLGVSR